MVEGFEYWDCWSINYNGEEKDGLVGRDGVGGWGMLKLKL